MLRKIIFSILHPLWRIYDGLLPKRPDYWAFATHHLHTGKFIENPRAMFEHIKSDEKIKKIIFYRGTIEDLCIDGAVNYEVIEHGTLRGLVLLARCKVVFISNTISMDFSLRWGVKAFSILKLATGNRVVVNLLHGISLKRVFYTANESTWKHLDRVKYRREERRHYTGLIASSDIDSYAMASTYYPVSYRQVWITGIPRNDFLMNDEEMLPSYIRNSIHTIRNIRQGRKLILYAPTYRQADVSNEARYYQFSNEEIETLKDVLRKNDAILGYRPHYFKNSKEFFNLDKYIDNELIYDLSQSVIPEISAAIRECDVLITDYSSVYVDALFVGKPAICFAYDLNDYQSQQDGLLYDFSLVFPGPIFQTFNEVIEAVRLQLTRYVDINSEAGIDNEIEFIRKIFFKYRDNRNSERVYEKVVQALERVE